MGAFDDLIPREDTADNAFADLVPNLPPAASQAPATTLAASATTPLPGTLPTTVPPTLAGAPPGTLVTNTRESALPLPENYTGVSAETDNAFADLVPPPLASPIPLTDPRTADTPLFPAGSNVGAPGATPIKGFLANMTPRDIMYSIRNEGGIGGFAKFLAGNTDAERAKKRKALGMDRDPIEDELNDYANNLYEQGGNSPQLQQVEKAITAYQQARDNPKFKWADLVATYQADPGAMAAQFTKLLLADPELLLVPLGWEKFAAKAFQAAQVAGAGRATARAAQVAGGVVGSAATGAGVIAPISVGQQLGESGTVDPGRTARETGFGAAASAGTAGIFVGLVSALRRLYGFKARPGADTAAIDQEITQALDEAEQLARQAGLDPQATRATLSKIVETPDGRTVVEPRKDVLDALPGQAAEAPPSRPSPARGEGTSEYLTERAKATPRDETGLEIAATEVGDPVMVKRETETLEGVITAKAPDDSPLSPYRYRVRLADGTELTGIAHNDVHPTPALIAARRALDAELYPPKGDTEVPAGGEIVPPRDREAAEFLPPTEKPDLRPRIAEYERLAGQATDPEVRATLQRQATILRTEAAGEAPRLTPAEMKERRRVQAKARIERARQLDPARDDLITAIRKLGGIDTEVETDYAGRLSHLPRRQFGLPAIERPGKGRTLDDLAEALHERGYLQNRDVHELYDKLDRAGGGETLHSFHADLERPDAAPRPRSTDRDWRLADEADAEAAGGDYILTDEGAVVPARPLTLDDLINLEKENTDAERWFQREAAADEGGAGRDRLPQRLGDQASGRVDQPRPGETAGLPGVEPRNEPRQQVADAERAVNERLRGREDVPVEAGAGDLFSGKAKQTDLDDVARGRGPDENPPPAKPDQTTLYANPFAYALRASARDILTRPGRSLAAGGAGAVGGATVSEAEPGSPQWWLDVAAGAAAATVGAQFLRRVNLLGKGSIVDNARVRLGDWIETLPLLGRGPQELRELKVKQQLMRDVLERQTAEVGRELLKRFSPSERAMMADLIENRGIIKDLNVVHRQAQVLDDYLAHAATRMKALGMLSPDLEVGGYLHRYYAKHLGLDKLFKEAKGQSLSGSYSLARGTDDVFGREFFSPGAKQIVDEFEQISRDIARLERLPANLLAGDDATRLATLKARKRELGKIELREFLGHQNGRLRSFLFKTDEVGRAETGVAPVLADTIKSPRGTAAELELPTAPGVSDLKPTNYLWSVRGTKGKEAMLHRDWTQYERQSWGEIDDAGYRYVRGMAEVSHDLSLATLYKTIANNADWVSDTARVTNRTDWVFVPESRVGKNSPLKKYGALSGKYVRPDIWNGIYGYGRNPLRGGPTIPFTNTRVGDLYVGALNKWKLYKTVYNPVTHFNNSYSNVEMLHMAGYDARALGAGLKHMAQGEKSALWKEARDEGLFGKDWGSSIIRPEAGGSQVLDDLAEQLRTQPEIPDAALVTSLVMDLKHWWLGTKQSVAAADGAWASGAAVAQAMGQPALQGVKFATKPVGVAARAMQKAYKFEDEVFKMAVYTAERAKGTPPDKAAILAQEYFFNYQDLPLALKLVREFPIGSPFISYPYFAIQAIAKNIAERPERVLFLAAGYEALNYAALVQQGLSPGEYWQVESAEETTSPPWDRGRALWGARNTVRIPYLDGYRLSIARSHALGNPFMAEAGGREKLPDVPFMASFWGSSIFGSNPLHALLDTAVNEDWKGKEIYKPGAPVEDKAARIASYLWQAWSPANAATPGGYQQARILEGLANDVRKARKEGRDPGIIAPVVDLANRTSEALGFGQFTGRDRADNDIVTRDALLASFGIKLRPVRVQQSVEFEASRYDGEKRKAEQWYAGQVRDFTDGRLTEDQMRRADEAFDAALDRLNSRQDKLFDAEAFLKKRTAPARRP